MASNSVNIRYLPRRAYQPTDPKWTKRAIEIHKRTGVTFGNFNSFGNSEFGRSWDSMKVLREKCLPQLSGNAKPVRVLEIGVGQRPIEIFEICDHLMKAGIRFKLAALDINLAFLRNIRDQKEISPVFNWFDVPREYYTTFLGQAVPDGRFPLRLPVPNGVRKNIKLMQGNIAAVRSPRSRFDIIICLNVLMYLRAGLAQALAIQNMAEGLRSGGFLITDGFVGDKRYHLFNAHTMGRMGFRSVERIDMERLRSSFGKYLDRYHQFVMQKN